MRALAFERRDRLRAVRQGRASCRFCREQPYGSGSSDTRRKGCIAGRSSIAADVQPYRHLTQQLVALADAIESRTVPAAQGCERAEPGTATAARVPGLELEDVVARLHADFRDRGEEPRPRVPGGGILRFARGDRTFSEPVRQSPRDGHAVGIMAYERHATRPGPRGPLRSPHCIDLTGYTKTVRHLLALFHRASLLVTNDGGPGQFAAITSVPTIVLFGPETPVLYGTLSTNSHASISACPARRADGLHHHVAVRGDNQCLKRSR